MFPCRFVSAVFIIMLGLLSCRPFHPAPVYLPAELVPETFSQFTEDVDPDLKWWLTFQDNELNRLIEDAFENNLDLKTLWARVEQARASAVKAGADLYPHVSATAGTLHSRRQTDYGEQISRSVNDYSLGLTAFYQADVWGKNQAERQAAIFAAEAGEYEFSFAAITLAAEITQRWLQIISQRMQLRLLHDQLENNEILMELIRFRFRQAMVSILDIYQQQQVIDSLRAQIPLVEARKQRLTNELAVLLGKAPQIDPEISRDHLPFLLPFPAAGIPAQLLENRPDIRAAQLRLESAGWNIAAAKADRLPSISFTARSVFNSRHLDLLLDNWLLSLASNITAPLFDANLRAAEVDRLIAFEDENLAAYKQTVLIAVRQVEDTLMTESRQLEHIERLMQVIETARKALDQATVRYMNGLIDYLPVLTQILTVQGLERNLIDQQTVLLANRVDLFRALGGTWTSGLISLNSTSDANNL